MTSRQSADAARRSEALLAEHLTPEQRREYEATGTVTVVKHGPIRPILGRYALMVLIAALIAVACTLSGYRAAAALSRVLVVLTVLPFFAPTFLIACSRKRTWRIDPEMGPKLLVRRKRVDFCVRIDAALPSADRILAYKNIIEANEPYFLRKANARF
jgi:hypothetical protein